MGEKTLDPTDHKLEEAHKKGQVPVSKTLASFLVIAVGMETAFALEDNLRAEWVLIWDLALASRTDDFDLALGNLAVMSGRLFALVTLVYVIANIITGIVGYWGQFGVVISGHPLIPDINRINPKTMLEQTFTLQKVGETFNSTLKLVIVGILTYSVIRSDLPNIVGLSSGTFNQVYAGAVTLLRGLFHYIMGALLVLTVVDFLLQRSLFIKQQKMDFEEVFREYKDQEGDPTFKSMRRQLGREILNSDPVKQTEESNAVVVNPTHFAVALFFDPQKQPVPIVCAKGADHVAQAMIKRARDKGIPVIRHVWLARTLFAVGKEKKVVPRTLFDPVALVYTVVEQLRLSGATYYEVDNSGRPPTEK